jgi:hypothetical protein
MLSRFALVFLVCLTVFGCEGDYTIYSQNPGETVYVEIPGETVYIDIPGEGGDVWVDSFEQPFTVDGVDIIWLIDQSGSMNTFNQAVIDGIGQMMSALPAVGWRLGITTTDYMQAQQQAIFPLVPGDTVADAEAAYNTLIGLPSYREAGFDALHSYIALNSYNQTWLRNDAALLVVFVSDEDEQSSSQFTSTNAGLQEFIQWYGNQRQSVFMASIVNVDPADTICDGGVSATFVGDRYMDATDAFSGVVVDICEEDWSPGVAAASSQVDPYEEWPLTYTPIEDTLIVFEDTVPMADTDWVYNAATNSIEFLVVPYEGALVEIGYVIDHDAGDDDDSAGDDDDSAGS